MSTNDFDWESFLKQWSKAILDSMDQEERHLLPQEVLASGWLGYPGATDEELARVERRIGMPLPPSYRSFLTVSNGWRQTAKASDTSNHKFWSTEDIDRFSNRHASWIREFSERQDISTANLDDDFSDIDDQWEPIEISNEEYLIYDDSQDPSKIKTKHLNTAIEISDVGIDSIYLLNPQVVTPEGEWEAWFFADYLPGADRYPSFRAMMEAEYKTFLEFQGASADTGQQPVAEDIPEETELATVGPKTADIALDLTAIADQEQAEKLCSQGLQADSISSMDWQSLRTIMVDVQARTLNQQVDYRILAQSDKDDQPEIWSGLTRERLQFWVMQQIEDAQSSPIIAPAVSVRVTTHPDRFTSTLPDQPKLIPEQPDTFSDSPTAETKPEALQVELVIEVDQLIIHQPGNTVNKIVFSSTGNHKAKSNDLGFLSSHRPFSVELCFHVAGHQANSSKLDQVIYKVQVFAQNRINHQWITLGETQDKSLISGQSDYQTRFFNKNLTAGLYRLQVITSLTGATAALSSFEIPLINVT